MELPQFELSDWIQEHLPHVKYNLGESGIEPPDLAEAGIDLDVEGFYRRHPGRIGLEEVVAEFFGVEPGNVLVTASSSEAIYLVHRTLLEPGDEVVVPTPNYPAELKLPEVVGAKMRSVELKFDEKWRMRIESVQQAMNQKTRLISITNSHNPTGLQPDQSTLKGLLDLAEDTSTWLLSDEAFREFGFENAPPPAATMSERAISLGTMSKFYGVDDVRIGWVLADFELVKKLRQLKTWITSVNSHFGEYVAKQVLENHEWFVERARRFSQENLEQVRLFMKNCPSLDWVEPNAALFCFPKIEAEEPSLNLCERLAEEHGVMVNAGSHFGREGFIRICFTQRPEKVKTSLNALKDGLNSIFES